MEKDASMFERGLRAVYEHRIPVGNWMREYTDENIYTILKWHALHRPPRFSITSSMEVALRHMSEHNLICPMVRLTPYVVRTSSSLPFANCIHLFRGPDGASILGLESYSLLSVSSIPALIHETVTRSRLFRTDVVTNKRRRRECDEHSPSEEDVSIRKFATMSFTNRRHDWATESGWASRKWIDSDKKSDSLENIVRESEPISVVTTTSSSVRDTDMITLDDNDQWPRLFPTEWSAACYSIITTHTDDGAMKPAAVVSTLLKSTTERPIRFIRAEPWQLPETETIVILSIGCEEITGRIRFAIIDSSSSSTTAQSYQAFEPLDHCASFIHNPQHMVICPVTKLICIVDNQDGEWRNICVVYCIEYDHVYGFRIHRMGSPDQAFDRIGGIAFDPHRRYLYLSFPNHHHLACLHIPPRSRDWHTLNMHVIGYIDSTDVHHEKKTASIDKECPNTVDGPHDKARFLEPTLLSLDLKGRRLFVFEERNRRIRCLSLDTWFVLTMMSIPFRENIPAVSMLHTLQHSPCRTSIWNRLVFLGMYQELAIMDIWPPLVDDAARIWVNTGCGRVTVFDSLLIAEYCSSRSIHERGMFTPVEIRRQITCVASYMVWLLSVQQFSHMEDHVIRKWKRDALADNDNECDKEESDERTTSMRLFGGFHV